METVPLSLLTMDNNLPSFGKKNLNHLWAKALFTFFSPPRPALPVCFILRVKVFLLKLIALAKSLIGFPLTSCDCKNEVQFGLIGLLFCCRARAEYYSIGNLSWESEQAGGAHLGRHHEPRDPAGGRPVPWVPDWGPEKRWVHTQSAVHNILLQRWERVGKWAVTFLTLPDKFSQHIMRRDRASCAPAHNISAKNKRSYISLFPTAAEI